jgi:hypothetical protein
MMGGGGGVIIESAGGGYGTGYCGASGLILYWQDYYNDGNSQECTFNSPGNCSVTFTTTQGGTFSKLSSWVSTNGGEGVPYHTALKNAGGTTLAESDDGMSANGMVPLESWTAYPSLAAGTTYTLTYSSTAGGGHTFFMEANAQHKQTMIVCGTAAAPPVASSTAMDAAFLSWSSNYPQGFFYAVFGLVLVVFLILVLLDGWL